MDIIQSVLKKRWSHEDIEDTIRILQRGEDNRSTHSRFFSHLNYYLLLLIIVFGNVAVALAIVPFFLIANDAITILVLIVLGGLLGLFTDTLTFQLEKVGIRYYILVSTVFPFIIGALLFFATRMSNRLAVLLDMPAGVHSPLIMTLAYVIPFLIPFYYHLHQLVRAKKAF